jgi:hypothetical protein
MMIDLSNNIILKDNSKRSRKSNAVKLPPLIKESMIPKYVVYYKECYNREKQLFREFFKIEKHPKIKQKRIYTSSKSNKIGILEKLDQIKKILEKLELEEEKDEKEELDEIEDELDELDELDEVKEVSKDIPKNQEITLPKYVSLKKYENKKFYLFYDKKLGSKRETFKALCNNNISLLENVNIFMLRINEKYNE